MENEKLKEPKETLLETNVEKFNRMKKNGSFCSAPWLHVHSLPAGHIMPCCMWDYGVFKEKPFRYGNMRNVKNMTEVLNNDEFKKLRLQMMAGEKIEGCIRCYDREGTAPDGMDADGYSMRGWFNQRFFDEKHDTANMIDYIMETQPDGSLNEIKIRYLDIRFGNICNLRCRMCGHGLSSSWYDEEKVIHPRPGIEKFIHTDCYDKIEEYLPHVTEIYFAGGEPFLYPEHLKMLDKLIEIGNTTCAIKYNTNLATLKYKKRSLLDVWKHFPNVHIGASIDDMEDTVEYIRTNMKWKDFKENFERVRKECPHVGITAAPTLGVLNIETYPDFDKFQIENGWTSGHHAINYIMAPDEMNIYYMPTWYKDKLIRKYEKHRDWIHNTIGVPNKHALRILEILKRLKADHATLEDIDIMMDRLKHKLEKYDVTAGLNWKEALPHIAAMLHTHYWKKRVAEREAQEINGEVK
tara:strand:+ start:5509 stop:6906 length:1398 start_codon:yes stop_codon:yes gene_type:complete